MTTIKKISVQNIKAVDNLSIELNWATAIVTGGNNKWKSTLLRSVIERIRWEKPQLILKDLTKSWLWEIELMDWSKFIRDIKNNDSDKLTYISSDWLKVIASVDIRNKYFPQVFDIDKFLNLQPKQQLEQIKKITWLDLSELEELKKNKYESRKDANRLEKEYEARLQEVDAELQDEEIDTESIISEIATIDSHNNNYDRIISWIELKKQEKADLLNKIKQLEVDIENWEKWVSEVKNKPKNNKEELQNKLQEIKNINERIRDNKKAKEIYKEYVMVKEKAEKENEELKKIEEQIKQKISDAKLPYWFTIDDWWLLYEWMPLERSQQSSSRLYIASLILARELIWDVHALHFDASFLDKKSLHEILDRSESQWLQLLIERPDYDWWEIRYEFISKE